MQMLISSVKLIPVTPIFLCPPSQKFQIIQMMKGRAVLELYVFDILFLPGVRSFREKLIWLDKLFLSSSKSVHQTERAFAEAAPFPSSFPSAEAELSALAIPGNYLIFS